MGGAERFALGLAQSLPRDRFETWVCSTRGFNGQSDSFLTDAGIRHVGLGRRAKWDVHRLAGLATLLRRERFDVLHAHMFGSNLWGSLLGRACGVPVVLAHEHNWSYTGDPLRMLLDGRVIGRLATRFIAVSSANRERMVMLERVPADKVLVMPTAYIPSPGGGNGDLRAELGLPPGTPLVGVAAVLRKEKALDVLLTAHEQVVHRISDAHLVIAGEGECLDELEQIVDELRLNDRVHFLGKRDDVDSILRAVDVGAMSSDWEGMPLFVFECMAAGTVLVATAVGGLPEVVEQGKTGFLVPPNDPESLADALVTLLTDRGLRERVAAAAAARLDQYTIDSVTARFAEMYERLTAEARGEEAEIRRVRSMPRRTSRLDAPKPRTSEILVLCYHAVSRSWDAPLAVHPEAFEHQMTYLVRHGWRGARFSDAVLDPPAGRILAITFDDAYASVYELAMPILDRLGLVATVFAPTAYVTAGERFAWAGVDRWLQTRHASELTPMSWEQLGSLAELGWEIGSHTCTHPLLTALDDEALRRELVESREECARLLGRPCQSIAYPYGDVDQRVATTAGRAGYAAGASLPGYLERIEPYGWPRVGIYNRDARWRFRLKMALPLRLIRSSPPWLRRA